MTFSWPSYFSFIFFIFSLELTWSLHVFHLCYRVKWRQLIKPLLHYLVFKEKKLCCETDFYSVFNIVMGMATSWSPLITLYLIPFSWKFIHLTIFHSVSFFNGFILSVSVMLFCAFLNFYLWLILIRVSVSILFGRYPQMLRWLIVWLLHVFLTCKDNFILIRVWCVTGWPLSTNVFHASICCMHMFGQKQYIAESVYSY